MGRVTLFEISIQQQTVLKEWKHLTQQWYNEEAPLFKKNGPSKYFEFLLAFSLTTMVKTRLPDLFLDSNHHCLSKLRRAKGAFMLQIIQFPKMLSISEDLIEVFFQKIGKNDAIFRFHREAI